MPRTAMRDNDEQVAVSELDRSGSVESFKEENHEATHEYVEKRAEITCSNVTSALIVVRIGVKKLNFVNTFQIVENF